MKLLKIYRGIGIVLFLLICLPAVVWARAEERLVQNYALKRDGAVYLKNISGRIEISGWDKNEVRLEALKTARSRKRLDNISIEVTQTNGTIKFITRRDRGFKWFWAGHASVHYQLMIPDKARVRIETVSGDAYAQDIGGSLDVRTVSGDIEIRTATDGVKAHSVSGNVFLADIIGDTEIKTTSGEVETEGMQGSFEAESVSGDIDLTGLYDARRLEMETISGNISIQGNIESTVGMLASQTVSGDIDLVGFSDTQEIEMETLSGDIDIQVNLRPTGRYVLSSHSGTIWVALPEASSFDFYAKASSGDIECDFDLKLSGKIDRKRLKGIVGKGGADLSLSTFSGDIRVEKRN